MFNGLSPKTGIPFIYFWSEFGTLEAPRITNAYVARLICRTHAVCHFLARKHSIRPLFSTQLSFPEFLAKNIIDRCHFLVEGGAPSSGPLHPV